MRFVFLLLAVVFSLPVLAQRRPSVVSRSLVPDRANDYAGKVVVQLQGIQATIPPSNAIPFCFAVFSAHNFTDVAIDELAVDVWIGPIKKTLTFQNVPVGGDEVLFGASFIGNACLALDKPSQSRLISCISPQMTQENCASRFIYLPLE